MEIFAARLIGAIVVVAHKIVQQCTLHIKDGKSNSDKAMLKPHPLHCYWFATSI